MSERSDSCDTDTVSDEVSDTSGDVANCNGGWVINFISVVLQRKKNK